jgi:hypothetical protein
MKETVPNIAVEIKTETPIAKGTAPKSALKRKRIPK